MEKLDVKFVEKAQQDISQAKNIVIVSHKNPDGDAIGSGLALYHLLKNKNKNVVFVVPNQLPVYLNWMNAYAEILNFELNKEKGLEILDQADLFLMLDFNHRSRLSDMGDKIINSKAAKILIDHHPNPEEIAELIYSRTSASSTAEMVYEFIESVFSLEDINKTIAECLFVGIMTDTGSFSYNSSNPITFGIVSNLLKREIDKDYITDKIYNNYSESRLRLLGHAINTNLRVLPEYQAAYIFLSKKDLENYNFQPGDTEGFVNYPLSIHNVVFSAIFIEKEGVTKCSFRSKGSFPANIVSKENFNGGGHINAAGGESKLGLSETINKFEEILPKYEKFLKQNKS
ncbi:MAG: bifunctional oligoribonuclease/PAP phosphatase NrnA [Salinivirgaceae bacterium]|nr:bifunctional oligoribonuclease/PAP phosphatase NrnA [Salinivirgaceae bacterium]